VNFDSPLEPFADGIKVAERSILRYQVPSCPQRQL
jgi:hypothetical protein